MTALKKLKNKIDKNLHICVGLDTDTAKIPRHLLRSADPVLEFNKIIIENTYEFTSAYKINFAFYEKLGAKGFEYLSQTRKLIPPDTLAIADAKRGDIGNTSQMYAKAVFDELKFDAVTLSPYMGFDSIQPFLAYKDKLNFILVLTSNKGAEDFEKTKLEDGKFLYQKVLEKIKEWNTEENCGIVYGATNSEELKKDILLFDDLPVLLPGVGAQGGNLEELTKQFISNNRKNFLINISRALLYLNSTPKFGYAVRNYILSQSEKIRQIIEQKL